MGLDQLGRVSKYCRIGLIEQSSGDMRGKSLTSVLWAGSQESSDRDMG
jgi:hypothetical protein